MNIAIRTDASVAIGGGHLMRCLALATALRKDGAQVLFVSSGEERKWVELIERHSFECATVAVSNATIDSVQRPTDWQSNVIEWCQDLAQTQTILGNRNIDWLIVDHYHLDQQWESALRNYVKRILVVDDLANRPHDCDVLVDCVYGRKVADYQHLVPPNCRLLLGTNYALLRPEFNEWRETALNRRQQSHCVQKILVSLGGVDDRNLTGQVLDHLNRIDWRTDIEINVVLGLGFLHTPKIENQCASMSMNCTTEVNVQNMADKITHADLGIGAVGVSTWERFCLGLPSVNLITQPNQVAIMSCLSQQRFSGIMAANSYSANLVPFIEMLAHDRQIYSEYVDCCSRTVDGQGINRLLRQMDGFGA